MRIDHQFMGGVINVDILTENHDFILIAEQRCYLLERHALGLGKEKPGPNGAKARYDDEDLQGTRIISMRVAESPSGHSAYKEELPPNIRKGSRRCLQVHKIGEGDGGNRKCDALGAEMVRENLAIKDHAGHVDAAAIEKEEDVAISSVRY
jgi:hypothetical protein